MIQCLTVDHVWQRAGCVVMQDGMLLPIAEYLDEDGEECEPADAALVIAGLDGVGWISFAMPPAETMH